MNDDNQILLKTTEFSLNALEQKLGASTDETEKMRRYLTDLELMPDHIVTEILNTINQRITELTLEFADTIPPSEPSSCDD